MWEITDKDNETISPQINARPPEIPVVYIALITRKLKNSEKWVIYELRGGISETPLPSLIFLNNKTRSS